SPGCFGGKRTTRLPSGPGIVRFVIHRDQFNSSLHAPHAHRTPLIVFPGPTTPKGPVMTQRPLPFRYSLLLAASSALLLLACGKKQDDGKLLIGLSLADLKEERWKRDRDYFVAKARELGAEVIVQDASGDPNAQLRQTDALLARGVKALVVVPKNADAARPIVLNAKAKGVPVISYDRLIADAPVDLYLSFDNVKVGEIQARAIAEKAPRGNYLILKGDPADKNSDMIHEGHVRVLKPLIDKGDIRVVAIQSCDKWLRSEALRITADA